MNEYLRVCKDCVYHEPEDLCNVLAHPERYNPVTGEQTGKGMGKISCTTMRLGPCTLDGLFYAKRLSPIQFTGVKQGPCSTPVGGTLAINNLPAYTPRITGKK